MSEKLTTNEMATMLEKIATDVNGAVASSLMKTLLSKNITVDDWNTFAKILADHSINDTVLQEFSKAVVEYLEALDSKDKSLTDNISTLQTDVGVLKTDMSGAKEDITILKDRMEMAENDIFVNAGDITRLTDSVDQNTTDIADLKYRMEQAETDVSVVKDEIADLKESKLDKTGGTISGDLDVAGNLFVNGKNYDTTISSLKDRVDFLSALLFNTIITNTTVEDTYTTRVTAGGLPVVSNTPTTVHKITGASVASANLAAVANQTIVSNGVTFIGSATDGTVQMTGSVTEENEYATATVTTGFYLPVGTYTLYAPHKADKVGWHVRNAQGTSIAELNWNGTTTVVSFTVSAAGSYHLYVFIPRSAGTLDYTETPMLLRGDRTANLPAFEPYYAGIKSAGFRGITSTGRNLIASLADKTVSADGITAVANPSDGTVTINGRPTTASFNADVSVDFYLPRGTYTIYAPHRTMRFAGWLVKSRKSGATVGKINWASLSDVVSNTFTVTEPGEYYIRFFVPIGYNYPAFENYVETPMILPGALTENFPAFETYHADTTFALTEAVTVGRWDYIDVDNRRLVTGTAEVTQDTEFTDEELATYPAGYILSADRKTIVYPLETQTTAPLTVPKSYTVWRNGMETVDTGDADALPPTITQTYYEEVTA